MKYSLQWPQALQATNAAVSTPMLRTAHVKPGYQSEESVPHATHSEHKLHTHLVDVIATVAK